MENVALLTNKPIIYAANMSEEDFKGGVENNPYFKVVQGIAESEHAGVLPICAEIEAEIAGKAFDQVAREARELWNRELARIRIDGGSDRQKTIFYTALYHTMVAPSEFCDVNGDYRGADGEIYRAAPFVNYTTFSLWDTYRAAQPLMTILHPEKMPDIANTMLHIYRQQGKLPVWHLMGNETDCMVGNPGIPALADAVLKGYGGFDREQAYEALKQSAMLGYLFMRLV